MFKSFAVALLSATALAALPDSTLRGANDGSDQDNAKYTSLIKSEESGCSSSKKFKLDLFTYIAKNDDKWEIHGDTVAYWDGSIGSNILYGFCLSFPKVDGADADEQTWDC